MGSHVNGYRSLPMAAALPRYRLLREDTANKWALCGVGEVPDALNPLDLVTAGLATDNFVAAGELLR